jgi:hypothetical protein
LYGETALAWGYDFRDSEWRYIEDDRVRQQRQIRMEAERK